MHKCDSHRSYFFLSTVLRSLILMQTEITYFSLSLASSHHHLLPSTATLSSKIVLQSKWRAGNPTPSPLPEPQTMWMLCIHSRTKSLPLGTFPSDSLSCCPVVCVSFLYLGICCSLLMRRAAQSLCHDLGLGPPSRLQIMKENRAQLFPFLKLPSCFLQD